MHIRQITFDDSSNPTAVVAKLSLTELAHIADAISPSSPTREEVASRPGGIKAHNALSIELDSFFNLFWSDGRTDAFMAVREGL